MHQQHVYCLIITWVFAKTWLLISCDIDFYAIYTYERMCMLYNSTGELFNEQPAFIIVLVNCLMSSLPRISVIWAVTRESLSSRFLIWSYQNQPAQLQRLARIVKFRLEQLSNKRKTADQSAQAGLHICCSQTPKDRFSPFNALMIMKVVR